MPNLAFEVEEDKLMSVSFELKIEMLEFFQ